jgi:NitT/TauT family transport system substrate-binding protein
VVPLGTDQAQIAAMRTAETEGMPLDVASAALLEEKGDARILIRFGDVIKDFINHVTFATNTVMKDHPDEVREFLAAWFETVKWMRTHEHFPIR